MKKLIYNGRIYCASQPAEKKFCEALIIEKGRIVKTGSSADLLADAGSAEKIDAEGALVLPAFSDGHGHIEWTGERADGIEAAGTKSIEEVISRGRKHIAALKTSSAGLKPGTFVLGVGVNPDLFSEGEKRDLCREDLDKISTEHPLILTRPCGHVVYCNSLALRLAGISESAPEVAGGTVDKDKNGKPTGALRETATSLVYAAVPDPSEEESKNIILKIMKKAHSLGICSIASNDSKGPDYEKIVRVYKNIFDEARKNSLPALRVTMQCGISTREDILDDHLKQKINQKPHWEDPEWGCFLKVGCIKLFVDGSLGGHTAWMNQPFCDNPATKGLAVLDRETLKRFYKKSTDAGMQVFSHAIGDAAMEATISAIENVTTPGKNPLRHGIIHCQVTTPELLDRMAKNNILGIVQPIFVSDDKNILESRVGPKLASTSYAWHSMHSRGIPMSYSTDSPVSPLDPMANLQWAVLRGNTAAESHNPAERVDIQTAIDAYTQGSAYSVFEENSLGLIAPGYLADLVFLDRDLFSIPPEDIHKARVLRTICAGETVYKT